MQFGLMHGCQCPQECCSSFSPCEQAWSAASKKSKAEFVWFCGRKLIFFSNRSTHIHGCHALQRGRSAGDISDGGVRKPDELFPRRCVKRELRDVRRDLVAHVAGHATERNMRPRADFQPVRAQLPKLPPAPQTCRASAPDGAWRSKAGRPADLAAERQVVITAVLLHTRTFRYPAPSL
jgi:hypothetical protein